MSEIDRLEIAIESDAKKANSELNRLTKRLEKVSSILGNIESTRLDGLSNGIEKFSHSMESVSKIKTSDFTRLAKNIDKISNVDSGGLSKMSKSLGDVSSRLDKIRSSSDVLKKIQASSPRFISAKVNKPQSSKSQSTNFDSVGTDREFTGNYTELTNEIKKSESQLDRLLQKESKLDATGVNQQGKQYQNLQYDIANVCNWLDTLYSKQKEISNQKVEPTIQHHTFPDQIFQSFDELNNALDKLNSKNALEDLSQDINSMA